MTAQVIDGRVHFALAKREAELKRDGCSWREIDNAQLERELDEAMRTGVGFGLGDGTITYDFSTPPKRLDPV